MLTALGCARDPGTGSAPPGWRPAAARHHAAGHRLSDWRRGYGWEHLKFLIRSVLEGEDLISWWGKHTIHGGEDVVARLVARSSGPASGEGCESHLDE